MENRIGTSMEKYIFLLILYSFHLFAGELTVFPINPKVTDTLTVTYNPDGRFNDPSNLVLQIYEFSQSSSLPQANEISFVRSHLGSAARFSLNTSTVMALLRVADKSDISIIDNNKNEFWEILVYADTLKPIKGAYLASALTQLGNLTENLYRNVNYKNALALIEQEINNYPDNLQAQIGLISLKFDLKKITRNDFEDDLNKILKRDLSGLNENELKAVTRALRSLNKSDDADYLEKEFIKTHPYSELAEEALLTKLSQANSQEEFTNIALKYFRLFPQSSNRGKIFSALNSAYLQSYKYKELIDLLDKIENPSVMAYAQAAQSMLGQTRILMKFKQEEKVQEALRIFHKYLENFIESDQYSRFGFNKPPYFSALEWRNQMNILKGNIAEISAEFFLKAGKQDSSIILLKRAMELYGRDATQETYEKLISQLVDSKDHKEAFNLCEKAILDSKSSDKIYLEFEKLYKLLNPSDSMNIDTRINNLDSLAEVNRIDRLTWKKLDQKPLTGNFKTLDGRLQDFEDLTGKVTVINFWSTWCGPCQAMLPAMEALYQNYLEDPRVFIITINVWEDNNDRVKAISEFLKKTEYDFPIFYDNDDIIPQKAGFSGLPATIFIDKNGRIQFLDNGFSGEGTFLRDANDKIKLLLK